MTEKSFTWTLNKKQTKKQQQQQTELLLIPVFCLLKQPISYTSKLKCYLKPTLIPILYGKEEVFNYDPRVSMYHDVITEGEMMFLKGRVMDKVCKHVLTNRACLSDTTFSR